MHLDLNRAGSSWLHMHGEKTVSSTFWLWPFFSPPSERMLRGLCLAMKVLLALFFILFEMHTSVPQNIGVLLSLFLMWFLMGRKIFACRFCTKCWPEAWEVKETSMQSSWSWVWMATGEVWGARYDVGGKVRGDVWSNKKCEVSFEGWGLRWDEVWGEVWRVSWSVSWGVSWDFGGEVKFKIWAEVWGVRGGLRYELKREVRYEVRHCGGVRVELSWAEAGHFPECSLA